MDFILAFMIFTMGISFYLVYSTNISDQESDMIKDLMSDAKLVSSSLVSEGYPIDWNTGNVKRIGLTDDDGRLIPEKIGSFNNLSYNLSKTLLGTYYDYTVFFEYNNGTIINISNFCAKSHPDINISFEEGECNVDIKTADIKHLAKTERFIIYDKEDYSDIIKMVVYVWA